jgi:hypothetical protein
MPTSKSAVFFEVVKSDKFVFPKNENAICYEHRKQPTNG